MVVVRLTRHFAKRWGERCGFIPTIEEINQTIGEATKIQSQMLVYCLRHGEYRAFKILAAYWHDPSGVIIKVDEESKSAVTVIASARNHQGSERGSACLARWRRIRDISKGER